MLSSEAIGKILLLASSSFWRFQHSLACRHVTPVSASIVTWCSPRISLGLLCSLLIKTTVVEFKAHPNSVGPTLITSAKAYFQIRSLSKVLDGHEFFLGGRHFSTQYSIVISILQRQKLRHREAE